MKISKYYPVALVAAFAVAITGFFGGEVGAVSAKPNYLAGPDFFFANGTAITIREDSTLGTVIEWEEHGGESQGGTCDSPCAVTSSTSVLGGYLDTATETTTSITMLSGTVKALYGGGFTNSTATTVPHVTDAVIDMRGGTVTGGVYGGGNNNKNGGGLTAALSPTTAPNIVDNVTITIGKDVATTLSGTFPNVSPIIYAGAPAGQGYVGSANITISGGNWGRVIASGASGYLGEATVNVKGGHILAMQGLNRGRTDDVVFNITGGVIDNLYAGADCDPTDATGPYYSTCRLMEGTVDSVEINLLGGTVSNLLSVGYDVNGSIAADTDKQEAITLTYVDGLVDSSKITGFGTSTTTALIEITIDGKAFLVEAGKKFGDYTFDGIRTKAGWVFGGFKDGQGTIFKDDSVIEGVVELTTIWTQVEENPETSDNIATFALVGTLGVVGAVIGGVMARRRTN